MGRGITVVSIPTKQGERVSIVEADPGAVEGRRECTGDDDEMIEILGCVVVVVDFLEGGGGGAGDARVTPILSLSLLLADELGRRGGEGFKVGRGGRGGEGKSMLSSSNKCTEVWIWVLIDRARVRAGVVTVDVDVLGEPSPDSPSRVDFRNGLFDEVAESAGRGSDDLRC